MEFNKHSFVLTSEYDNSFKSLITAGWVDKQQGSVQEPSGHLSMVTLDRWDQSWRDYLNNEGLDVPSAGLYLVHENEFGFAVVFAYEDEEDRDSDWAAAEDEVCEEV